MPPIHSTYRLQLHSGFSFDDASATLDYLHDLGISHVYCSPYLQAAPGSTHGYDVVDYHHVNRELGGEAARQRFYEKLAELGMGQVLDIVPNHMAIGRDNAWWWDTLENGALSRYAPYFDIDWNPPEERLRNKILLPLLGDHYGRVLASGELTLARDGGAFLVRYYERRFPVAPESIAPLLARAAVESHSAELGFLADSLERPPLIAESDWSSLFARDRNKVVIRGLLSGLLQRDSSAAAAVDALIAETNADPDALDAVLSRQNYRLSRWRTAERELVYRRFFDINTLVGVRMEDEHVFEDAHLLILEWLRRGELDGIRVDHPDGLRDPAQYFRRLRRAAPESTWIVAEKILQPGEQLPASWNIAGTTGYDFLNLAGGLFIDPRGEAPLNELYRDFTGEPVDFAAVAHDKKVQVLREILGSDLNRLTGIFLQICEDHREERDYTRHEIHEAIREVIAAFPVYRTYVRAAAGEISDSDQTYIAQSIAAAKRARPDLEERLFDFLADVLCLHLDGDLESEFVMRFQQVTAAAMAKGVEDTAFYSYLRLVSLNEVGGDPGRFGTSIDAFHNACIATQQNNPRTMLASSTHDTKRSEDARARIGVLSEMPAEWSEAVRKWSGANAKYRTGELPDRKTEYLLYQTLVGSWPISKERLWGYMRKAAREAKERTSWIAPNAPYEEALEKFTNSILDDPEFISEVERFLNPLMEHARTTSLALALLKLTAPGIPDIYQGTELWDLSLVDPDNRRPVDFSLRRKLFSELDSLCPGQIMARAAEGLPKLWTIRQALRTRNSRPRSFGAEGNYQPLWASGPKASHVIAFQRGSDVITIVPRLVASLDTWDGTVIEIPEGRWRNPFTDCVIESGKIEIESLLAKFPVALLA